MNDDVKAARESIKEFRDWAQRLNQLARHSKDGMSNSLIAADNQRAIEVKTKILLAHIDGEPARIAAACEETREAVARHVMGPALKRDPDLFADHLEEVYAATIRRMPLTATPLADALRLANESVIKLAKEATEAQERAAEGVRYWTDLAQAEARDAATLRARVAELEAEVEAQRASSQRHMNGRESYWVEQRTKWIAECDRIGESCKWHAARAEKAEAERDALRAWVSAVSEALGAIEPVSDCRVELSADAAAALAESLRAQVEAARKVCELRIKTQWRVPDVYITAHDVLRAMDGEKP